MSESTTAPEVVRASVNDKKLLGSLQHIFASSFSVLGELMQNARRAGATRVDIEFDPPARVLRVSDNGHGVKDFQDLVVLAQSGWDEQTQQAESPFGMGLFSVLFAAERVVVRSRGKRLALSAEAVIEKRDLRIEADDEAVSTGTRIELFGLSARLMEQHRHFGLAQDDELATFSLYEELRHRAKGFAIPVHINGRELPRPHAQESLPGETLSIGFVSITGIHRDAGTMLPAPTTRSAQHYLQGLPINRASEWNRLEPEVIIHLDQSSFAPRMPDRSCLYDLAEAEKRIAGALRVRLVSFLRERKAQLDGEAFASAHWADCRTLNVMELLNDVHWIPTHALYAVGAIQENRENMLGSLCPVPFERALVSRADFEAGRVKLWRHAPDVPSDAPAATLLLKIMQREDILGISQSLPAEHWLNQCTPDVDDFDIKVSATGARGEGSFTSWDWTSECSIRLADEVEINIDTGLGVQTFRIKDDWVLLPAAYDTECFDWSNHDQMQELVCFLAGQHNYGMDQPVDALSSYIDGNDEYRTDWHESAARSWSAVVSGMLGESMAGVVAVALNNSDVWPSQSHLKHMALVRTTRTWRADGVQSEPRMNVVCLQSDEFWCRLALLFDENESIPLAQRLRSAFEATVQPGQTLGVRPEGQDNEGEKASA